MLVNIDDSMKEEYKKLLILGAGGHAKVLIDTFPFIYGVIDNEYQDGDERDFMGKPIIGDDSFISHYGINHFQLINGIGSIKTMKARKNVYEKFPGFKFPVLISDKALVSRYVTIGAGTQVLHHALIQADVKIGENCIINTKATVSHDCVIGNHCHLAPSVTLSGGVTVGNETHIGCGATVIQSIKIGSNVTIGAGTIVIRDVPDNCIVAGVPARIIYQKEI